MSAPETVLRIAAKGDGVTSMGRHIRGAVPGDMIAAGGAIKPGPNRVEAPCRHFERCGGCQLQNANEAALTEFVTSRVLNAAQGQQLVAQEIMATHLSPPQSRRRATLHGLRTQKGAVLGYRESGSHKIVDLHECPVLAPALTALFPSLRRFISKHGGKGDVTIEMALSDQGVDVSLGNIVLDGLEATEAALDYARDDGLARLCINQGYGPETVWEPEPVTIRLSGVAVPMPSGAFLQATQDAQERLVTDASDWLEGAGFIADLFAGLGTFAFGLRASGLGSGRKVLGVEADRAAHLAFKSAAGRAGGGLHALHRDLFRNPLQPDELNRFDAAILDPPRAGAKAQIEQIAQSELERVVYISCNPSSWSRDAATLANAGFSLEKLRPVGQFRWSTHVELASLFTR